MKKIKKLINTILMVGMILSLSACGGNKIAIDYADAESFEAALNNGDNLEGKVVQFVAEELNPDSAFGYDIFAGEHLNFVSSSHPNIKEGDTVVVKATKIESVIGSWIITYEKVSDAVVTESTISSSGAEQKVDISELNSDSSDTTDDLGNDESSEINESSEESATSFPVESSSSELPLELVDYGWFINDPSGDTAYVEFCGMIKNPNDKLVAQFPKVLVTVKDGDGSIVATEEQVGSIVMPGDTITLCGMFSMLVSGISDDAQIVFDVDWSEFSTDTQIYSEAKTTDFVISNVSERNGSDENFITGEITNNFSKDIDQVNLSIVLRKDGKIVFMENTFVDGLKKGKTKAFEFQRYNAWPEHDTIDVSAMVW